MIYSIFARGMECQTKMQCALKEFKLNNIKVVVKNFLPLFYLLVLLEICPVGKQILP
jgi:hypothetical protein